MEAKEELFNILYQARLPRGEYVHEECNKKQFVLHHTAGPGVPSGAGKRIMASWAKDKQGAVATAFTADRDGKVAQHFSSKCWAWGLGIGVSGNMIDPSYMKYRKVREQEAVQVEIDSWGMLREKNGKWTSWAGTVIPKEDICFFETPHRGGRAFHKYTDEQIRAVEIMAKYLNETYGIPLDYNEDMWDVSPRALKGEPGIWTHCSYVTANLRNDCFPQPELVQMLKSLK